MRIALIAPPWVPVPPTAYGGTETIVDSLARGFQAAGHDVMLFTTADSTCPVKKEWILDRVDSTRLNWSEVELRHVIAAYEAVADYDVVHDHTMLGPVYSARFPQIPVVMTQHHPFDDRFIDMVRASNDSVPLVAISHDQASHAQDIKVRRVIHHGLDPNDFKFCDTPDDYFVFLGRMSPNKGAARAAAIAREAGVKLKIAARLSDNEGEREYFENEVKPLLNDDVQYIGEVSLPEKVELLRHARALLNPIRWDEPFGLVMIESFGSGTPVISFKEGAAKEIIENGVTGFLCDDESEMIDAIGKIDQIDRHTCRTVMETHFSNNRMVADYLDLFEELTAESQTPNAAVIDLPGTAAGPIRPTATGVAVGEKLLRKPQPRRAAMRKSISRPWPAISTLADRADR